MIAVLAQTPSTSSDRAATSCPLFSSDFKERTLSPQLQHRCTHVPTRAHTCTCTAPLGAPGRTGISSTWDQGSPWGRHTREAGPRLPSFLGRDLPRLILLVRAAAGPEPRPSPQARLWSPGRCPLPRMWNVWAFWLPGFLTNGRVHWQPGGKGQRTLGPPGRDVARFGPHSPLPQIAGTPQPWQPERRAFSSGLWSPRPTCHCSGLPRQGQNQLSLPEAPEMCLSRDGYLDGYFGRQVTRGGWSGARPLLWGVLSVPCGAACELKGHRAAGRPREAVGAPAAQRVGVSCTHIILRLPQTRQQKGEWG